ncbi:aspartate aminotransferase family protein [Vibrio sp. CAIM 722]|uniref:Aspartate aminotransferase family protein n=1 Tax=Vibrio eleionomae TaxID=2653505 RepID=A0A7X4LL52_9VIBR|nr:aspartate aminotransferase family protein [Vibrio eleionomae]MZI93973.1 aspartate aminotransferase family protein [Vibrio eleionomae]
MNHIFQRHCHSNLPIAVKGQGVYITDSTGKQYLDGSGGAAVSCLGHNHPHVRSALHHQIDQLAYAHTGFFNTDATEALAEKLIQYAPGSLDKVYFLSGGSEAIEAALKVARQYCVEKGETSRSQFIARKQSYHGNTLGALAAGGNALRRAPFAPLLMDVHHISPCFSYRNKENNETSFEYGQRVANELEDKILEVGAENIIGFIAEPVVGATIGAVAAEEGYFKRVRAICNKYNILLILDEVMCGIGRTGTLFAHEQENIEADIVTVAKGLGAGYQPIAAMLTSKEIHDTISNGSGFFQHGHTYMGHAVAAAGSLAVLETIENEKLLGQVIEKGHTLQNALMERLSSHPFVGDIRGRGLFRGIELVRDRETKQPFSKQTLLHSKLKSQAMDLGLMCYPMQGTADGENGHHILLAPAFIMNNNQIDELADKLSNTIDLVTKSIIGTEK